MREQAIFWLGQRRSQENADFLQGAVRQAPRGGDGTTTWRKKVMFSLSQMRGVRQRGAGCSASRVDNAQSEDVRGHALWTAGQAGVAGADLVAMYDRRHRLAR